MIDFPKEIKMGPLLWQVDCEQDAQLDDDGDFGQTQFTRFKIVLDSRLPNFKLREGFLHELIHAVGGTYLNVESQPTEAQTKALSAGLMAVFVDNPSLKEVFFPSDPS